MTRTIYPVILSGGSGTRLWPLSRDLMPKQLLSLVGPESLLAGTVRRVTGDGFAGPIVVCNQDHRFLVQEQLAAIGVIPEAIIIEPVARNTAPAIAAAAAWLQTRDPGALLLVLPSDHLIRNSAALSAAIVTAAEAAEAGRLVTFGITPTAPETGYGYIRQGGPIGGIDGAFDIAKFVEKPNLATAAGYLAVTVKAGGEVVFAGGTVASLNIAKGGKEGVAAGFTASGLTAAKGVTLVVSGAAVAVGTVVSAGGVEQVQSYGSAIGTTVLKGGELVLSGGTISGLSVSSGGAIDLATFAFNKNAKLTFVENGAHTKGTLTITDGTLHSSVILFGQYAANGFHIASDGAGGTAITYGSASTPALELAARH